MPLHRGRRRRATSALARRMRTRWGARAPVAMPGRRAIGRDIAFHLQMRISWRVGACLALAACKSSEGTPAPSAAVAGGSWTRPPFDGAPLGVHCNALVDAQGRTVFLHGVNARIDGVF